jgi:hypothetical protein
MGQSVRPPTREQIDILCWAASLGAVTAEALALRLDITPACRAWARCSSVAGVLYLAPDRVERALERAIDQARASEQIVVVPLEGLLPSIGSR